MRLLLDTHALVWWWRDDDRLPESARQEIDDPENDVVVSAVVAWEIANKYRIGKWPEVATMVAGFAALVSESGFELLALNAVHALAAGGLPGPHRDPFDRLLAGQALSEALTLVSGDREFLAFGVPVLWSAAQ